jgi:hypothetical protein
MSLLPSKCRSSREKLTLRPLIQDSWQFGESIHEAGLVRAMVRTARTQADLVTPVAEG